MTALKRAIGLAVVLSMAGATVALAGSAASDVETSRVRIIRLSYVEGKVTLARANSSEWSAAPANTPIEEGFRLATGAGGFAEVEFENGSTVRLGENSRLDFTQLGRTEAGDSLNRLTLVQGYGTLHVFPGRGDVYELKAGDVTVRAQAKSEFRVDLDSAGVRLEDFQGSAEYSSPQGSGVLSKNHVLEVESSAEEASITHGITRDDWDAWVAERDQEGRADEHAPGEYGDVPSYGWGDLNQYGAWSYYPGYGYGWSPYVASLGPWSPFTYGQWVWYPGFGYTWVGYEPWGWLPYHYGSWFFDPFGSWFWVPGAFGFWDPAPVNWFAGNGLVGWCPNTMNATPGTGAKGGAGTGMAGKTCQVGHPGCIVTVPAKSFGKGTPVNEWRLIVLNPSELTRVARPGVGPASTAMLPGKPAAAPLATSLSARRVGVAPGMLASSHAAPSWRSGSWEPRSAPRGSAGSSHETGHWSGFGGERSNGGFPASSHGAGSASGSSHGASAPHH